MAKAVVGQAGPQIRSHVAEGVQEILADQAPDLGCLPVVGVVVSGREHVGAEHDAAHDLFPEAFGAGAGVHGRKIHGFGCCGGRSAPRRSGPGWSWLRPWPGCSRWRWRIRCAAATRALSRRTEGGGQFDGASAGRVHLGREAFAPVLLGQSQAQALQGFAPAQGLR